MTRRLKNKIALSGATLALAIALPAFAQYQRGYIGQGYYAGPGQNGRGAYDRSHNSRGARWWHQHYIERFYPNHPAWSAMDSSWLNEEGDYDNNNWHNA